VRVEPVGLTVEAERAQMFDDAGMHDGAHRPPPSTSAA
jgi:hypothetical protein